MTFTARNALTTILMAISVFSAALAGPSGENESSKMVGNRFGDLPLAFTENQGQWDERIEFRADVGGASAWFTDEGIYYHFVRRTPGEGALDTEVHSQEIAETQRFTIRASFVGSNPNPEYVGEGLLPHKCNYFIGNDPMKWFTNVSNYTAIVLNDIYPGIDLKYYGNNELMEYDLVLSPGADPSQIEICYEGAETVTVDEFGRLVVQTDRCVIAEMAPIIFQKCPDGTFTLEGKYVLLSDNTFGFQIKEEYDDAYAVVIDPVVTAGSYVGGSAYDDARRVALDGSGNIILAGYTASTDMPTLNEYQSDQPDDDIFVAKFDSSGAIVYCTYLGGNSGDKGYGVAADDAGNAYIAGQTSSNDYPVFNAYMDTHQGGVDVCVTKLNPSGNGLVFSTYLGGSSGDYGAGIALGSNDESYVTGRTMSSNFPLLNSYDQVVGNVCAFVTRFNGSGSGIIYSSVVCGDATDRPHDIAVDNLGHAYIVGETYSTDYPTVNAYQTDQIDVDGFVTKFSLDGSSLEYSTYLGGDGEDCMNGVALNQSGQLFIVGETGSTDFPVVSPYQTDQGGQDVVVVRLDDIGQPVFSTYLGSSAYDNAWGIDVDPSGYVFVTGKTNASDFPLANPFDSTIEHPNGDMFVTKLDSTGHDLIYSTFVCGYGSANGNDLEITMDGSVIVAGIAQEDMDIDMPGAWDPTHDGGSGDGFWIKIEKGFIVGDANGSAAVDIDDVVYLIAYIFSGGPAPVPYEAGDANCSGAVDIDDVVYVIAYIFSGGPPPGDPDDDGVPDC